MVWVTFQDGVAFGVSFGVTDWVVVADGVVVVVRVAFVVWVAFQGGVAFGVSFGVVVAFQDGAVSHYTPGRVVVRSRGV